MLLLHLKDILVNIKKGKNFCVLHYAKWHESLVSEIKGDDIWVKSNHLFVARTFENIPYQIWQSDPDYAFPLIKCPVIFLC